MAHPAPNKSENTWGGHLSDELNRAVTRTESSLIPYSLDVLTSFELSGPYPHRAGTCLTRCSSHPRVFFTDDLDGKPVGAQALGIPTHHFTGVVGLREALRAAGVID